MTNEERDAMDKEIFAEKLKNAFTLATEHLSSLTQNVKTMTEEMKTFAELLTMLKPKGKRFTPKKKKRKKVRK